MKLYRPSKAVLGLCLGFLTIITSVWASHNVSDHDNGVEDIAHKVMDPLLNSGQLVISALLLGWGFTAVVLYIVYRDGRKDKQQFYERDLKNLQLLSDLNTTIKANTEARLRTGA